MPEFEMKDKEKEIIEKVLGVKYCIGLFYEIKAKENPFSRWCTQNLDAICCRLCSVECKRSKGRCAGSRFQTGGCAYPHDFLEEMWNIFHRTLQTKDTYKDYGKWEDLVHKEAKMRGLE